MSDIVQIKIENDSNKPTYLIRDNQLRDKDGNLRLFRLRFICKNSLIGQSYTISDASGNEVTTGTVPSDAVVDYYVANPNATYRFTCNGSSSSLMTGKYFGVYTVAIDKEYGVSWSGSSDPTFTRTLDAASFKNPSPAIGTGSGSSPFDDIYPWSEMKVVTLSTGEKFVRIPKFYVKLGYASGSTGLCVSICQNLIDGYVTSPAHMDRGDGKGERDYVYVGRYPGNSSYRSMSGSNQVHSITRGTARNGFRALAPITVEGVERNYYQWDFLTWETILYLYLVEYATFNSQTAIGSGVTDRSWNGYYKGVANGQTDNMIYHTGRWSGTDADVSVQYRNIENLWGNMWEWIDGININGSTLYICKDPSKNADNTPNNTFSMSGYPTSGSGVTITGWNINTENGLIYPKSASGTNYNLYSTDGFWANSGWRVFYVGGSFINESRAGALAWVSDYGSSDLRATISSRAMLI